MLKNLVIIVLVIVSAVMSYKYLTVRDNIKVIEKEVVTVTSNTGNIKLFKESENIFSILSDDGRLDCLFIYDENGLQTFSIHDYLTDKSIGFNISNEKGLASYLIEDKKYRVATNIVGVQPEILIQREEWYNDYRVYYELLPDGSTNLTVKEDKNYWRNLSDVLTVENVNFGTNLDASIFEYFEVGP